MTLLVRDEEDVIATNIDYHLRQGVDFVIATDHASSDTTADILREYERMGVLRLLRAQGEEHDQSRHVTEMARLAADRYRADWVINNDADEFWWPHLGTLKDVFAAIPERYGQLQVSRQNFIPRPEQPLPFYRRLVIRETRSRNISDRPLEPKVTHRAAPEVVVEPGNHAIRGAALAPAPEFAAVEIFHFPMRSFAQFERKVMNIGIGYESLRDRSANVGCDQLKLLDLHRAGRLRDFFDADLLDAEQLACGIERGELVVDRRLERFLSAEPRHAGAGEWPERLALQTLGAQVFGHADRAAELKRELSRTLQCNEALLAQAATDLVAARDEQAALRVELASVRGERATLRTEHEALRGEHAALRDELQRTWHSYRLLLSSRIVRCSRRARVLYYRLRPR